MLIYSGVLINPRFCFVYFRRLDMPDRVIRINRELVHKGAIIDSGDHLHPSEAAYKAMSDAVPEVWLR